MKASGWKPKNPEKNVAAEALAKREAAKAASAAGGNAPAESSDEEEKT
jgi:hypothetical protein